jgi:thiol-disulfide isomerase/thioredoxin
MTAVGRVAALGVLVACGHAGPTAPPGPPPAKKAAVTSPRVEDAVVEGYVTLVDFWAESCAACEVVAGKIGDAIAKDDRVIVRTVDVGDGFNAYARAYEIGALPHWKVYDAHRRLRYVLIGKECLRAPGLARELVAEP